MQLYFIPFACSLAARIALNEAGLHADYVLVRPGGLLPDGGDFAVISPMGYVPALRTDDERVLTEGPAVLQHIGDLAPGTGLTPPAGSPERVELQMWLNFLSTELHKAVFAAVFNPAYPDAAREHARSLAPRRFDLLAAHLDGRDHLLPEFSVADAYLLAILNWCEFAGIDLTPWPVLMAWRAKTRQRPSVAQAMATEAPLREAA